MELQTINQVSKALGISGQMLRYYERNGLITSQRKEDYSYRVYDSENIRRIQHIIILRKLQIPVKQIAVILNSTNAVAATEIFKENILSLDKEIVALEVIKSALDIFVSQIEKLAPMQFNLNFLNDETVKNLTQSLCLTQKNIKEFPIMKNLNQASEYLTSKTEKNVMVIRLPKCNIVTSGWQWESDIFHVKGGFNDWVWENQHLHKEVFFGASTFWFNKKPDYHGEQTCYNVTVSDTVTQEDVTPYKLINFEGGLYAALQGTGEAVNSFYPYILKWLEGASFEPDYERFCLAQDIYHAHNIFQSSETRELLGDHQMMLSVPIKPRVQKETSPTVSTLETYRPEVVKKFFSAFNERFGTDLKRHYTEFDFDKIDGSAYVAYMIERDIRPGISVVFELNADEHDPCVFAGFSMVHSDTLKSFGDKMIVDDLRKHYNIKDAKPSDWYICFEHLMFENSTINLINPHWGYDNYAKMFEAEKFNEMVDSAVEQARMIFSKLRRVNTK